MIWNSNNNRTNCCKKVSCERFFIGKTTANNGGNWIEANATSELNADASDDGISWIETFVGEQNLSGCSSITFSFSFLYLVQSGVSYEGSRHQKLAITTRSSSLLWLLHFEHFIRKTGTLSRAYKGVGGRNLNLNPTFRVRYSERTASYVYSFPSWQRLPCDDCLSTIYVTPNIPLSCGDST